MSPYAARPALPTDGYETLLSDLCTLLTAAPPSFIYIHDPATPRISSSVLLTALQSLSHSSPDVEAHVPSTSPHIAYAHVSALSAFTPRLFYDTVLNALAGFAPRWEDGCLNWSSAGGERFNENVDGFLHGLMAAHAEVCAQMSAEHNVASAKGKGKGKQKAKGDDTRGVRLVLLVDRAERLKDNLPDLVVPLTRLAELTRLDLTTIFHSQLLWYQIRPSLGVSPDPFFLFVPAMSKQTTVARLAALYPTHTTAHSTSALITKNTYHPILRPLFAHFVDVVYNVCSPFVLDPDELAYIVAARWPGFVQPILDEWEREARERRRRHRRRGQGVDDDGDMHEGAFEGDDLEEGEEDGMDWEQYQEPTSPSEDTRLRLTRIFTPSLTNALELLYPRLMTASAFLASQAPPKDLLAYHPRDAPFVLRDHVASTLASVSANHIGEDRVVATLPRMAKFVLIAAFLASTNPAKTDIRMFGRAKDESVRKRKGGGGVAARRGGGSPRKRGRGRGGTRGGAKTVGTAVKIPQRLLGPLPFPLDRLLAILGILLEEHDAESRPAMPQYSIPGEYTEVEISRLEIYRQINTLTSMHLLHRVTTASASAAAASEFKLELSPSLKSGISYEVALRLAKDVGIQLGDLLWENE